MLSLFSSMDTCELFVILDCSRLLNRYQSRSMARSECYTHLTRSNPLNLSSVVHWKRSVAISRSVIAGLMASMMGIETCLRILSCSCSDIFGNCPLVPISLQRPDVEGVKMLVDELSNEKTSGIGYGNGDGDFSLSSFQTGIRFSGALLLIM
jgi:hypothetical protein